MKKGLYIIKGNSVIYAGGSQAYNIDIEKFIPAAEIDKNAKYIATLKEVMGDC